MATHVTSLEKNIIEWNQIHSKHTKTSVIVWRFHGAKKENSYSFANHKITIFISSVTKITQKKTNS